MCYPYNSCPKVQVPFPCLIMHYCGRAADFAAAGIIRNKESYESTAMMEPRLLSVSLIRIGGYYEVTHKGIARRCQEMCIGRWSFAIACCGRVALQKRRPAREGYRLWRFHGSRGKNSQNWILPDGRVGPLLSSSSNCFHRRISSMPVWPNCFFRH